MRYLMITQQQIQAQPALWPLLTLEHTQAQYELCSYAVPEDHPNLALILLTLTGTPDWQDLARPSDQTALCLA